MGPEAGSCVWGGQGEPGRAGLEKQSGNDGNRNGLQRKEAELWLQVRGDLLGAVKCWRYTLRGPSPLAAHSVSATLIVQEETQ